MPTIAAPTIRSIETIPLAVSLPADRACGMARGLTNGRATTLVKVTTSDGVDGWRRSEGRPGWPQAIST